MQSDDLIKDEPLDRMSEGSIGPELDSLNHRVVARRIAELANISRGHLNIALFGPWGSGKSSFYGLMKEELGSLQKDIHTVRFDAWKNSGPGFHSNFLHDVAAQVPHADKNIAKRLFQTRKTVSLPSSLKTAATTKGVNGLWWKVLPLLAVWFFALPAIWSLLPTLTGSGQPYLQTFWQSVSNWFTITYAPAFLVLVLNMIIELSKVSIEESAPGSVSQFGTLFDEVVGKKDHRYVIFIDELDRCAPEDVIQTLEGLRTFLGHRNCVFVVAFDRKAVASTIGKHLHIKVPNRPDRPYYSTAGEYLDKIFQFQISLPPQPPHTFRKYAFSLVRDRAGIWGELDPRVLARVVSILSPIHVTSPRRTKVLLNDFAVHVRILESLGFDAKGRAEEIAALTVIQTEFPTFAADLEIEPGLLKSVAEQTMPVRPALKEFYLRYLDGGGTVGLDEVIGNSPAEGSGESEATSVRRSEAVEERLLQNLRRFLRLLQDMRCPLPKADLILMHSDGDLLSFDDPSVYNTVLLAADLPVEEALEQLNSCTPRDRARAVEFLLEHVEGETPTEAANLVMIAGELIGGAAAEDASRLADPLVHGWNQVTSNDPAEARRFSANSLGGFAVCHVLARSPEAVFSFFATVKEENPDAAAPVLGRIINEVPPEDPTYNKVLATEVAAMALKDVEPLALFARRQDTAAPSALTVEFARVAVAPFVVASPVEVPIVSGTTAAQTAARVENDSLREKYELDVTEAEEAFELLVRDWSEYSVDGSARSWAYQVLRDIGVSHNWAFDRHDKLIGSDSDSGLLQESNDELLLTLTAHPDRADRGWSSKLHKTAPADAALQEDALNALFGVGVDEKIPISAREAATLAALDVSRCLPINGEIHTDEILRQIKILVGRDWDADDAPVFALARALIDAAGEAGGDLEVLMEFKTGLYSSLIESVEEPSDFTYVLYALRDEPVNIVASVAKAALSVAEGDDEGSFYAVQIVVACHNLLRESGAPVNPVSAGLMELVLEANHDVALLNAWVQTCPSPAELNLLAEAGHDVFSASAETWQKYADRSKPADSTEVWLALRKSKAPMAKLKAIATQGVDCWLYSDIVDSLATGTNSDERREQQQLLLSLPTGNANSAIAAVRMVEQLATRARRTDAPMAVSYILANQDSMSNVQKASIFRTAGSWINESESSVGKTNLKKLRDAGILPEKSSWFKRS